MWETNKHCLLFMGASALILAGVYAYVRAYDPVLADKIAYTGFCGILFGGGVVSWLMARHGK